MQANLEEKLDIIASGDVSWKETLRDFWDPFSDNVSTVGEKTVTEVIDILDEYLGEFVSFTRPLFHSE